MRLITFPPVHSLSTPLFFYCCFRSRGAALLSRSRSLCGSSSHFGLFVGLTPQPGFFRASHPIGFLFLLSSHLASLNAGARSGLAGWVQRLSFHSPRAGNGVTSGVRSEG